LIKVELAYIWELAATKIQHQTNLKHQVTRHNSKTTIFLTVLFVFLLSLEYAFGKFFPDWTFKSGTLVITNKIVSYFSFFGLLFCIALLFRANPVLKAVLGFLFVLLLGILSCSEIHPIDTTTQPEDTKTIQTYSDGTKLVMRHYINAKTNAQIQDTVLVKDIFMFRRLYHSK